MIFDTAVLNRIKKEAMQYGTGVLTDYLMTKFCVHDRITIDTVNVVNPVTKKYENRIILSPNVINGVQIYAIFRKQYPKDISSIDYFDEGNFENTPSIKNIPSKIYFRTYRNHLIIMNYRCNQMIGESDAPNPLKSVQPFTPPPFRPDKDSIGTMYNGRIYKQNSIPITDSSHPSLPFNANKMIVNYYDLYIIGNNPHLLYSKIKTLCSDVYCRKLGMTMEKRRNSRREQRPIVFVENFDAGETIEIRCKTIDDIIVNGKEKLLQRIDAFCTNVEAYDKMAFPRSLCILLYGPPGTGKTSLAYAIALYLSKRYPSTYIPSIIKPNQYSIQSKCVTIMKRGKIRTVLIEEFDDWKIGDGEQNDLGVVRKLKKSDITEFLDTMEDGTILIATTNDIDAIDPAFIRAGRFQIKLLVDNFDKEAGMDMIKSFEKNAPDISLSHIIDQYSDDERICPAELQDRIVEEIHRIHYLKHVGNTSDLDEVNEVITNLSEK